MLARFNVSKKEGKDQESDLTESKRSQLILMIYKKKRC